MLLITRCIGQEIIIGNDISIKVLSLSHEQVQLGFCAPKEVAIHRREIYNALPHCPGVPTPSLAGNKTMIY